MPLGNSGRKNNKDAMFDYKNGFHQSEEKCNCHIYVTSIMIITFIMFCTSRVHYQLLFFYFWAISLVAFVYSIFGCCAGMSVSWYQIARTWG